MSNVVQLRDRREEKKVEEEFFNLLDRETKVDANVQPLSTSLLERMNAIKAEGEAAKARAETLQG